MLHEPGDGGMLLVSVQCGEHGPDSIPAHGRTNELDRTKFDVSQIGVAFTSCVNDVFISNDLFKLNEGIVVAERIAKCYQVYRVNSDYVPTSVRS